MAKAPSPLLGFNNNVRHKGRVFHIQTEDSGIRHPHIITHLFADGGRILKSTKTSYAEHIGRPAFAETVRKMMQEQHKAMFVALRNGQFDHLFDESAAQASSPSASSPGASSPGASSPGKEESATPAAPAVSPSPPPAVAVAAPPAEPTKPSAEPIPVPPPVPPAATAAAAIEASASGPPSRRRPGRPALALDPAAIHARQATPASPEVKLTTPPPVKKESSASPIDLDFDALERAAAAAQTPFVQKIEHLPPPPAATTNPTGAAVASFSAAAPRAASPPEPAIPGATTGASGRYSATRPSSIFATKRPTDGASIFGEDLISEKSLDEVILSYLAEDLEGAPDKK